jgi:hypothetical protein
MKKKVRSKYLDCARKMPKSYHTFPGRDFNVKKSEVLCWISKQPQLLLFVFDKIRNNEIIYDSDTGAWKGVDCEDLCPHGDNWDDCPVCRH